MALQLGLHFVSRTERVPQGIDFVEHHQTGFGAVGRINEVLAPDGQIGPRDSGIGSKDEHHRVGLGNQVDGELWLCTHSVQPWGIENHQTMLQQRVRQIDDGMAPLGHFHQPLCSLGGVFLWQLVVPEAQSTRVVHAHPLGLGHLANGCGNLFAIVRVECDFQPALGRRAPFGQALGKQSGFNWQKSQRRRQRRLIPQLGGAHCGSPCAGRHDAAPIAGKKDRVDQLGFPTRELRHKRNHDLVCAHLLLKPLQSFAHGIVHQIVRRQPLGQLPQTARKIAPPCIVLLELLVERGAHCGFPSVITTRDASSKYSASS